MKNKYDKIKLSEKEQYMELAGNLIAFLMLLAFFLKIVLF